MHTPMETNDEKHKRDVHFQLPQMLVLKNPCFSMQLNCFFPCRQFPIFYSFKKTFFRIKK